MNKNYKIYCDDCLNVISGMEDESVDLVVTDPPYKTITGGDSNVKNSVRPKGMLRSVHDNIRNVKKNRLYIRWHL